MADEVHVRIIQRFKCGHEEPRETIDRRFGVGYHESLCLGPYVALCHDHEMRCQRSVDASNPALKPGAELNKVDAQGVGADGLRPLTVINEAVASAAKAKATRTTVVLVDGGKKVAIHAVADAESAAAEIAAGARAVVLNRGVGTKSAAVEKKVSRQGTLINSKYPYVRNRTLYQSAAATAPCKRGGLDGKWTSPHFDDSN